MADNFIQDGKKVTLAVVSGIESGEPVVVGDLHGVATIDRDTAGYATVDLGPAVYDLSVTATSSTGDAAIEIGDPIYINPDTFALTNDATKKFFGHAFEAVAKGATSTINVRVQQAPGMVGIGEVITLEHFKTAPSSSGKLGTAATGTTGDENVMVMGANVFEYHILGTQTLLTPKLVTNGLDIGMDQTADDGVEITRGITSRSPEAFVVGASPAFYAKCKFKIADVSGTDDCAFGFRKVEAYQGNVDDYDEMAALNVISGDIKIETILNAAATTTTDTTDNWADDAAHTLEVYVSDAGVVTYKIDGTAPTVTAAFTFDTGEVVIPFLFFLNHTDLAGEVALQSWEVGLQ